MIVAQIWVKHVILSLQRLAVIMGRATIIVLLMLLRAKTALMNMKYVIHLGHAVVILRAPIIVLLMIIRANSALPNMKHVVDKMLWIAVVNCTALIILALLLFLLAQTAFRLELIALLIRHVVVDNPAAQMAFVLRVQMVLCHCLARTSR